MQRVKQHCYACGVCVFVKHSNDVFVVVHHVNVTERSDAGCHDNTDDAIRHDVSTADL